MKAHNLALIMVMVLLGCCFVSPDSLAFAQPIVHKANDLIQNMLILIRVSCIIICLAILGCALTGRVNWRWSLITLVVAICVGPAWAPIKVFLGVRDDGQAEAQGVFGRN